MTASTPCPSCGGPIGIGTFFSSLSPWHVRCPTCRAPLALTRREGRWIVAGFASACAAAYFLARTPFLQQSSTPIAVAAWVSFAVAADVVVCALCVMSCNARRRARGGPPR